MRAKRCAAAILAALTLVCASSALAAPVRVFLDGAAPGDAAFARETILGATIVSDKSAADLIWSGTDKSVVTPEGDPWAYGVEAAALQGVVRKWAAVSAIKTRAAARPFEIGVAEGAVVHRQGKTVTIQSAPSPHPYMTVFNLAPGGDVQFLYPAQGDPAEWPVGAPYALQLVVRDPPFGAEHVVAITSARPLTGLHKGLKQADPGGVAALLDEALADVDHRVGVATLLTAPKARR
ncbi:MAG: hypothetical protein NW215_02525 [Hyphomicrobiales bacterium]|nr:hypothetical protein [Hyphomicrobiales bacterium]